MFGRLTLVFILLTLSAVSEAQQSTFVIRSARVFDGTRLLGERDVLVRDGRIAAVGTGLPAPAGAMVIDGRGRTLLPGFIDAHTHTYADVLPQSLAFGVTTQLEMFTDPSQAARWRAEQTGPGAPDRADVYSAGILVTAPSGHGTQFGLPIPTISSPDSAQAFVDARIAEGSDYIKIVYDDGGAYLLPRPTLDSATVAAVIEAAHRRRRLAVVHVHSATFARRAIASGADGLVHAFSDSTGFDDFARLVRRRGAFVIPTLTVNMSVTGRPGGAGLLEDPRVDALLTRTDRELLRQSFPARPNAPARYEHAQATVRALDAAGVPILAGTDAPNPGTTHGAAMHNELALLVEAGLTPSEALVAATSAPARAFGLDDRGRIAPGLRADLVLVDGDPTTDITATRAIHSIWKGGVQFDRTAYAARARATRTGGPRTSLDTAQVSQSVIVVRAMESDKGFAMVLAVLLRAHARW